MCKGSTDKKLSLTAYRNIVQSQKKSSTTETKARRSLSDCEISVDGTEINSRGSWRPSTTRAPVRVQCRTRESPSYCSCSGPCMWSTGRPSAERANYKNEIFAIIVCIHYSMRKTITDNQFHSSDHVARKDKPKSNNLWRTDDCFWLVYELCFICANTHSVFQDPGPPFLSEYCISFVFRVDMSSRVRQEVEKMPQWKGQGVWTIFPSKSPCYMFAT